MGRVLTFTVTGQMTPKSFLRAVETLRHDAEYAASPRLWDFRGVRSDLTSSEMFIIGKIVSDMHKDVPSVAAYVANEGPQWMKLETYRKARREDLHIRRVFTDVDRALDWLNNTKLEPAPPAPRVRVERSET